MARTIYGDHDRFLLTYLKPYKGNFFIIFFLKISSSDYYNCKGYYFTGDGAHIDKNGYFQITGRVDDVINVR
jgi:acetyl-CoA synthetase